MKNSSAMPDCRALMREEAATGDEAKAHSSVGFGAVVAEVRVDPDLCTMRVARVIGAYDAGRIIDPRLAHSQCVGGIGMTLLEETEWDAKLGRVANATMAEYLVPICPDIHEPDATFVASEDTIITRSGSKAWPNSDFVAWHGHRQRGVAATGKRLREFPITPDRLLTA